jgi:Na+-translocating ferredoxin:NAD+ oxidoreductase RnfD subunit
MKSLLADINKDPRYYQIGFQGIFLLFGVAILGWSTEWARVLTYLIACLVAQTILIMLKKTDIHSLKSAAITSLGLGLLLQTNQLWVAVIASFIAILGKSMIRWKGKHVFNPGNLGIVLVVFFTEEAWISPGLWGSHSYFPIGIIVAGIIILNKVKRVETGFIFLASIMILEFARQSIYLGWPADFWWHRVSNGSILVYALFMITDPKTTPNHRNARIYWAIALAFITFILGYGMQLYAAPIYALFFISPFTPLFDKIWIANSFQWNTKKQESIKINNMKKSLIKPLLVILLTGYFSINANAFCGFYVAKAGAQVFNKKSQVILVHDGDRTSITMQNDFQGSLQEFAMVIPVPVVLKRNDILVKENSLFNNLDAYSAPRLVEYYDHNPCTPYYRFDKAIRANALMSVNESLTEDMAIEKEYKKKVKIEARYSIDEYNIIILSAKESWALEAWLTNNNYTLPKNAKEVLEPYIKNKMKFFAVKVNLDKAKNLPSNTLRPIQINFESKKFMLPIRLGMANSNGEDQDLIIYAFTRTGRVECANYRNVEMPTARKVPTFIKSDYGNFYKEVFDRTYEKEGKKAVFLEYAWNVSPTWGMKCDPCVGTPPVVTDLMNAGVYWINNAVNNFGRSQTNVFFTRLHVRYNRKKFPSDLTFIETPNKAHYQVRQIITNPATGNFTCQKGLEYLTKLKQRRQLELQEMEAMSGRKAEEYPYYIELGNGKKEPLIKTTTDDKEEVAPNIFEAPKSGPPFWILPLLIGIFLAGMYSIKLLSERINKT